MFIFRHKMMQKSLRKEAGWLKQSYVINMLERLKIAKPRMLMRAYDELKRS